MRVGDLKKYVLCPKEFYHAFVADVIFWLVTAFLVSSIFGTLRKRFLEFSGGKSAESLQATLLTLPPEQLDAFLSQLQSFAALIIGALIIVPIVALLLYSATRGYSWNTIFHKKFSTKNFWRWNGLNILLLLVFMLYTVLLIAARYVTQSLPPLVYGIILSAIVVDFVILQFVINAHFTHNYKVFQSIGDALATFNKSWKKTIHVYLIGFLVFVVLQFVQFPLRIWYFVNPTHAVVVQIFFLLIFLGWYRHFVVLQFFKK